MPTQRTQWRTEITWLDAHQTVSVTELSQVCGISKNELDELVEYGALSPLDMPADERQFSAACVATLRTAGKLRRDFDLDTFTIAVLLDYLNRIEHLEGELRAVQAKLPAQAGTDHPPIDAPARAAH